MDQLLSNLPHLSPMLLKGALICGIIGAIIGLWGARFLMMGVRLMGMLIGAAAGSFIFLLAASEWGNQVYQQMRPFLE